MSACYFDFDWNAPMVNHRNESGRRVLLIGAGGHARVVLDSANLSKSPYEARIVADDTDAPLILGYRIETPVPSPTEGDWLGWNFHVAIGRNAVREQMAERWLGSGAEFASVIHPTASVSPHALVEGGVFIGPLAVVNAGALICKGAIINSGAILEHDCVIGAYAHVGPGAALGGGCRIGRRAWLGLNSSARELIEIGDDVVLGAGAVAVSSLLEAGTYVGSPARRIRPQVKDI